MTSARHLTPPSALSPSLWVEAAPDSSSTGSFEGDCDCACSTSPFAVEFSAESHTPFQAVAETYTADLGLGFHLAFSPFAPAGPAVLNTEGWLRYQQFWHSPQVLKDSFDLQLAQQNLIAPQGQVPQPQAHPPDRLTVWLHITNACNLDCPYCYVRKSSAVLDRDQGYSILENLFNLAQNQGFQTLKLKYAGGEATLEFSLIRDLHDYAQQLAKKTGINLEAVVLSNGTTLNPSLIQWLIRNQVRLMVSLDGLGAIHDRQRPPAKGQPPVRSLTNKLDRLLQNRAVDLHLSVTITAANAPHLAETIAWILERNGSFSFNFYRIPPTSSNLEALAALALEEQVLIDGLRSAYQVIEANLPDRPLFQGLLDKVQTQAHTHTCGVSQSYLVITHEGKITQCQMHLDQAVSPDLEDIPPHLASDPHHKAKTTSNWLETVHNGKIQNLSIEEKVGCDRCTYRYRCTGGCPVETFRFTGRWDVKSPHCQIYQALYPEVLRLEGLRLLKIHRLASS